MIAESLAVYRDAQGRIVVGGQIVEHGGIEDDGSILPAGGISSLSLPSSYAMADPDVIASTEVSVLPRHDDVA